MELSTYTVGNAQYIDGLEQKYRGFDTADHIFMILHEWKKSVKNTRQTPTGGKLLVVVDELHIDKHHLCQVWQKVFFVQKCYLIRLIRQCNKEDNRNDFTFYGLITVS